MKLETGNWARVRTTRLCASQVFCALLAVALVEHIHAAEITVKKAGGDYSTIQDAIDNAGPGDTVTVYAGTYYERVEIFTDDLTVRVHSNDLVYVNGSNRYVASTPHMFGIYGGVSDLTIQGFHICSNRAEGDGSGIYMEDYGDHIQFLHNTIYEMRGTAGMGITVYGTDEDHPISNVVICGNVIYDCEPADSEALVLNGNVTHFTVSSNEIRDVNNIGIDFIGGETDVNATKGARHGVCMDNHVLRANSSYGGGYGAGIYVDGGRNIIVERNYVSGCDLGIEVGAENTGWNTTNITVRSNLIAHNEKTGLALGGYMASLGRVNDCRVYNNTLYKNTTIVQWHGEINISYGSNNVIENNIVYPIESGNRYAVLSEAPGDQGNVLDYNLYFFDGSPDDCLYQWDGSDYNGFTQYVAAVTPNETNSLYQSPSFVDAANSNFHLASGSVAIDRGDPATPAGVGEMDQDQQVRTLNYRTDIGAYEYLYLERAPTGSIHASGNVATTSWTAVPGARYEIERTDDLTTGIWTNVGSVVTASVETVSQPDAASGILHRFYRALRRLR